MQQLYRVDFKDIRVGDYIFIEHSKLRGFVFDKTNKEDTILKQYPEISIRWDDGRSVIIWPFIFTDFYLI